MAGTGITTGIPDDNPPFSTFHNDKKRHEATAGKKEINFKERVSL